MSLKQSNPYLRRLGAKGQRAALRVSVESSSAVEGIRAPFADGASANAPTTKAELIAQWRRRLASTAR
ncbi:MAG: hypothetical protein IPJ08_20985 [Burkholderiales bacterium]|nr:hypothetical protein [Burkholderiales bacterium]MBP6677067.1 hypothetical protein [Vitreoscilla sp.]